MCFHLCIEFLTSMLLSSLMFPQDTPPHPGNCSCLSASASPWRGVYQAAWPFSPSSQKLDPLSPESPPTIGSPLRGVSKPAQQGQSAGCSGQDLFTSNQESMQLEWVPRGDTSAADNTAPAKGACQGVRLSGRTF